MEARLNALDIASEERDERTPFLSEECGEDDESRRQGDVRADRRRGTGALRAAQAALRKLEEGQKMAGDRSSQGEGYGGTVHFRQGRPGERESGRRRGCGRSEGRPRRRSTSRRRGRRSMRSFATSRPIRRRRRSSGSWPISSMNTLPRSRIRRSSSSIRAAGFRRPRARASTGRNRLRGIESKEAGRRDAARFFCLRVTFPSLATEKGCRSIEYAAACGRRFIGEGQAAPLRRESSIASSLSVRSFQA